ncbi:MAG: hypothetical protein HDR20_14965 [Lachnospiraceae bacterium]|nr:hypothetical protein [Lachnospiraceae bacterium]
MQVDLKEAGKKEEIKETAATQRSTETAKEYTQRLKDVESATKWVDNFEKSMGYTAVCRHGYIDENGNLSSFTVVVRKDELNEKLRKEAQKNAEEQIENSKEKARENAEQLAEKVVKRAEQLLEERIAESKDGAIHLYDTDMQTIIEAAKEDKVVKVNTKEQVGIGANLDLQA